MLISIMAQILILFYLHFGPKLLILKTVTIILQILRFSPKFLPFLIKICKLFFLFDYKLTKVRLVCRMEENNNVVEETMNDDFEEGIENEKGGRRLRSDVWQSFSKLPRGKKAKCNYCKKQYVCDNIKGTSSLRTHLLQRCPIY